MKTILTAALIMMALSASAAIQFEGSDSAYEEIDTPSETTLTLSGFDAGKSAGTYIVISVVSKLKSDTFNPIVNVTFGGTPIPSTASEFVNDTYKGWANLYIAPVSGAGDIEVTYEAPTDDPFDAISISAASYSGVAGVGSKSKGKNDPKSPKTISDSISTTGEQSLIVTSLMLAGSGKPSLERLNGTRVREDSIEKMLCNGLLETKAPVASRYKPGMEFKTQLRAAVVSAELLAQ